MPIPVAPSPQVEDPATSRLPWHSGSFRHALTIGRSSVKLPFKFTRRIHITAIGAGEAWGTLTSPYGVNLDVLQEPNTTVTQIRISHTTVYHYRSPVSLNPHRLMLRPRESRELQLISHTLEVSPDPTIAWAQDVSGNAVATASFTGKTDTLRIESHVELEHTGNPWPIYCGDSPQFPLLLFER
jgi:hypothetical protein